MNTHDNADDTASRSPHAESDVVTLRALFAWSPEAWGDEPDAAVAAVGAARRPAEVRPGTHRRAHELASPEALAARGEYPLARDRVIALEAEGTAAEGALFARRLRRHAFASDTAIGEVVHDPAVRPFEMSRCIDHALREVASELAATMRRSPRTVSAFLERAHRFVTRFAATVDALEGGTIQRGHAEAILRIGDRIEPAAHRAAYEAAAIAGAAERTPAQLATFASRIAERLMPEPLESRHERAARERDVWIEDRDDGMAFLGAYGPAVETHAVFARITADANALRLAERLDEAAAAEATPHGSSEHVGARHAVAVLETAGRGDGTAAGGHLPPRSTRELRWDALAAHVLTSDIEGVDARDGTLAAVPANVDVLVDGAALLASPFVGASRADDDAGAAVGSRRPRCRTRSRCSPVVFPSPCPRHARSSRTRPRSIASSPTRSTSCPSASTGDSRPARCAICFACAMRTAASPGARAPRAGASSTTRSPCRTAARPHSRIWGTSVLATTS
ncbi:DUF222 domain-containing protein [Pseudoclavibacter chungangensis]|uniref:DUF222 domain-containing protein n=1 Tax=Pseudoclavibacter chungangensis TaxID=587635 RepID=A0A7J5BZ76_9MICO|nr:DUF222 domain-containing protein [Pseudoclavibacter chungangensis]KAB1659660.1 DUF222 domain-containing protein [Pseudoclavibacter chungangensis]NYJ67498.1 hypothetical protein [Pseudoclavibacter chungangensis]